MMICSNSPKFGGAPRQIIEFELDPVPGYCGSLGLEYVNEIARQILDGNLETFVDGDDAVKVLEVVEAIYRADKAAATVKVEYR